MKQEFLSQILKYKDIFEFKNYHLIIEIIRNINLMLHKIFNKSFAIRIESFNLIKKAVQRTIKLINRFLLMKNKNKEQKRYSQYSQDNNLIDIHILLFLNQ